jgi:hypothetical protein
MKRISAVCISLLAFAAGPAAAKEGGAFLVQLGTDTTSVETYVRDANRIEVDQVGRAPRVLRRHFIYDLANGEITHVSMVVTPPGSTTPTQTLDARATGDSMLVDVKSGANGQTIRVAAPKGTVPVATSSPWVMYELLSMRLASGKGDQVQAPIYFLGAGSVNNLTVKKLGRDSVEISSDHGDVYRARVDKAGHFLGVAPIAGTQKFGATRLATVDVDRFATGFAAREQSGAGMGMLSPRDSVKVATGGANLWIDYSRPSKRGRPVFGGIVPFGEVWRTGANSATQFRTDKDLDFNGVTVPAGFYTLWTIPSASGWKLVINSQTGQWGTEHDPKKDLYTIDMATAPQPSVTERFTIAIDASANGGVLRMSWDTTQASVPFTVKS